MVSDVPYQRVYHVVAAQSPLNIAGRRCLNIPMSITSEQIKKTPLNNPIHLIQNRTLMEFPGSPATLRLTL